jgi:hypothetical protein
MLSTQSPHKLGTWKETRGQKGQELSVKAWVFDASAITQRTDKQNRPKEFMKENDLIGFWPVKTASGLTNSKSLPSAVFQDVVQAPYKYTSATLLLNQNHEHSHLFSKTEIQGAP